MMSKRVLTALLALSLSAFALSGAAAQSISPDEARAIAKEAYIYGFPLVDSYRIQYSYFVDHD
ncbi:MAG TPA: cell envelope protein, partial [Methylovirgula sp.]